MRVATPSRFLFFTEVVPVDAGSGPALRRRPDVPLPVRWRLAGSNQRFTGVAAAALPDLASALADVEELRAGLHLVSGEVCAVGPGRWTWTLRRPDGHPLARAPRLYGRRVDCRRSLELFVAQVPTAGRDRTLRLPGQRQVRPRRPTAPAATDLDTHTDTDTDTAIDTHTDTATDTATYPAPGGLL